MTAQKWIFNILGSTVDHNQAVCTSIKEARRRDCLNGFLLDLIKNWLIV